MTKTVKEWLESIKDEEVRAKALNNLKPYKADKTVYSLSDAIDEAFRWDYSEEGIDYWGEVYIKAENGEL